MAKQLEAEAGARVSSWPYNRKPGHRKAPHTPPANDPHDRLNAIPACSPDIHKVVEHPLKAFKDRWYRAFTEDQSVTTCESLAATVLRQTTTGGIYRDIQTLQATLQSIVANRGDWAEHRLC